jgi:lipopolysaccharide biosynthesis glycosyltransferase
MKTVAFTAETRPDWVDATLAMARQFSYLNGIPCRTLTPQNTNFKLIPAPHYIKLYLWDLVPVETERIIWKDSDTIDVRPLDPLPATPFSAARDWLVRWDDQKNFEPGLFNIRGYFNSGFFVADRSTIPMFKEARKLIKKQNGSSGLYDQNILNLKVDECLSGFTVLPKINNWLISFGPPPDDLIMLHYAGRYPEKIALLKTAALIHENQRKNSAG